MTKKEKCIKILEKLSQIYPIVKCELLYTQPHELLIATRLSAQCTDKRVNIVTAPLFEKYRSIDEFANAEVEDVENLIRSCGLFKTKARDIVEMCRLICIKFDGKVPDNMDDLLCLPGIGRKTANLIIGEIYGKPAIVTDTHVIRLSNRFKLVNTSEPRKVELELAKMIKPENGLGFCHRLVMHGRNTCTARSPKCNECVVFEFCGFFKKP